MRPKESKLPSKEESFIETEKRLAIIKKVLPQLENFSEIVILVGSMAYGKYFSVRKESDIDLIIMINREDSKKLVESLFLERSPQFEEQIELFDGYEVDHFSQNKFIDDVSVQFHFWDKDVHFRVESFEKIDPKIYNIWDKDFPDINGQDFFGKKANSVPKQITKVKLGLVHDYPPYFIADGKFIPRTPILNLITCPEILFTKDKKIFENIEKIWQNLAKRYLEESKNGTDPEMSIMNAIYGNWNLSPESRVKLENKIEEVLKNVRRTK